MAQQVEFDATGTPVYFTINIKDVLGVDTNYPMVKTIINKSFNTSKRQIPVDSGLLKSSYSIEYKKDSITIFFDPNKMIGKKRYGVVVKDYYAKYLENTNKRAGWLDIIIKLFMRTLLSESRKLNKEITKKNNKIKESKTSKKKESKLINLIGITLLINKIQENINKKIQKGNDKK